jgi:threonine dehydrogenase-like Zn-dependent dehydrogenase
LLTVAALRSWGVKADIVARHPHQQQAAEALGGRVIDRPARSDYLCTFDAVCTQETLDACVHATMPGGRVLEFGMFWGQVQFTNAILFKEVSIVPAMGYARSADHDDFRDAADLAGNHPHLADTLVTHTFTLEDAPEAFRVAADRASGAIKVHLAP